MAFFKNSFLALFVYLIIVLTTFTSHAILVGVRRIKLGNKTIIFYSDAHLIKKYYSNSMLEKFKKREAKEYYEFIDILEKRNSRNKCLRIFIECGTSLGWESLLDSLYSYINRNSIKNVSAENINYRGASSASDILKGAEFDESYLFKVKVGVGSGKVMCSHKVTFQDVIDECIYVKIFLIKNLDNIKKKNRSEEFYPLIEEAHMVLMRRVESLYVNFLGEIKKANLPLNVPLHDLVKEFPKKAKVFEGLEGTIHRLFCYLLDLYAFHHILGCDADQVVMLAGGAHTRAVSYLLCNRLGAKLVIQHGCHIPMKNDYNGLIPMTKEQLDVFGYKPKTFFDKVWEPFTALSKFIVGTDDQSQIKNSLKGSQNTSESIEAFVARVLVENKKTMVTNDQIRFLLQNIPVSRVPLQDYKKLVNLTGNHRRIRERISTTQESSWDKIAYAWGMNKGTLIVTLKNQKGLFVVHSVMRGNRIRLVPFGIRRSQKRFSVPGYKVKAESAYAVKVCDTETDECLATLQGRKDEVHFVKLNSTGDRIVLVLGDNKIKFCTVTGECLIRLKAPDRLVKSVEFNKAGTRMVTASDDKIVRVWNSVTGACLAALQCRERVRCARFNGTGDLVAAVLSDYTVMVWDVKKKMCITRLSGHECSIKSVAFTARDKIVTTSRDKVLRWNLADVLAVKRVLFEELTSVQRALLTCIYGVMKEQKVMEIRGASDFARMKFDFMKYPHLQADFDALPKALQKVFEDYVSKQPVKQEDKAMVKVG